MGLHDLGLVEMDNREIADSVFFHAGHKTVLSPHEFDSHKGFTGDALAVRKKEMALCRDGME